MELVLIYRKKTENKKNSRKKSLGREINPTYYIFCEGKTEEEYIKFLKRNFRVPIEIKSKIEGCSISKRKIDNYLRDKPRSLKDIVFLLYDIDAPGMLKRLQEIKGTKLLLSNPCIELWFLLHHKSQQANINSKKCKEELEKIWNNYKKGILTTDIHKDLINNQATAVIRAKKLNNYNNPSCSIYQLIEILEETNKK